MEPTVKDTGLRDVSHSRCLHDVPDHKLLDGLVLGDTAGTVGAADGLHMATALLGTTVIPPFLGLSNADTRDKLQHVFQKTQYLQIFIKEATWAEQNSPKD